MRKEIEKNYQHQLMLYIKCFEKFYCHRGRCVVVFPLAAVVAAWLLVCLALPVSGFADRTDVFVGTLAGAVLTG